MDTGKLIVIGGNAAGMSAASKLRRLDPKKEIIVFEKGVHTSYSACGMPYFIAGQVPSAEQLVARTPEVFRKKQNIDVRTEHDVLEIDVNSKWVKVLNLEDQKSFTEHYDELLIATGTSPVIPDIKGVDAEGVFALSSLHSGIKVFDYIKNNRPQNAVIIGGGYIGIEMAEALLARKMNVALIDVAPQLMTTLDADMAELISNFMQEEGVKVYLEEKPDTIHKDSMNRVKTVITNKREVKADMVIIGVGIRPNSAIAGAAGLELGVSNAIRINKQMETSVPNVWAAGDCAESYHLLKKMPVFVALGTVANKHGLVAGSNIYGGSEEFPGVLGTAITKFNAMEISRSGLSEKEAKELGIDYASAKIESTTASAYYPSSEKITVKMLAERESMRLIGGQIVGMPGSGKRIDTIATAIYSKMTVQELMFMDLSYAPPFSQVWDPVQIAARKLYS
jgi:NADPH-dependent 2,4-dienoyl-CoA reductase/sulfur reductase-like enzyme